MLTLGEFLTSSLIFEGLRTATSVRKETICLYSCLRLDFVLCLRVRIERPIN